MLDGHDGIGHMTEFSFLHKVQRSCRFEPYLVKVVSLGKPIRYRMFKTVAGIDNVAVFNSNANGSFQKSECFTNGMVPQRGHLHSEIGPDPTIGESMFFGNIDCKPRKPFSIAITMEYRTEHYSKTCIGKRRGVGRAMLHGH